MHIWISMFAWVLTGICETDTSIYKLDNIVQFVCAVVCVFVCVCMPRRVYACNLVVAQSTETTFAFYVM